MDTINIVLVGESGSGKTSLFQVYGDLINPYEIIIEDVVFKTVTVDDEPCKLQISNYPDPERPEHRQMLKQAIRASHGILCVYSTTSFASFEALDGWKETIERERDGASVPIVLVGSKCDLEGDRQVGKLNAGRKANEWGALFLEASAENRSTVDEIFEACVREVRRAKAANPTTEAQTEETNKCAIV